MFDQERFDDAVRRLSQHSYEVLLNGQAYIVRHTTDANDVSNAYDLDQLIELADLIEWRHRRGRSV